MPHFSIVIPTQARADTLAATLRTVVRQDCGDVEIVVHESGNDEMTAQAVAAFGNSQTQHVRTFQRVSMTENWERALDHVTGEYVTFVGDDDGLLPDACSVAARILSRHPAELLSWRPACYFWPNYVAAENRNRLQLNLDQAENVEIKSSRLTLELMYRFRIDYSHLPMIYNSFVSRSLIEKIRARRGRYFSGSAPDVVSGIVNAFFSDCFLLSRRPLSCTGLSHNSTGHRVYFSGDEQVRARAETEALGPDSPARLSFPRNLKLFIGQEMSLLKAELFPESPPALLQRSLAWSALQSLHGSGPAHPAELAEVRAAAASQNISTEKWHDRSYSNPPGPGGVRPISQQAVSIDLDCSRLGTANIDDACRLAGTLLPASGVLNLVHEPELMSAIPPRGETHLNFSRNGNGQLCLGFGWSDCEDWGVWSLGSSAELHFRFLERPAEAVTFEICGRMLLHPGRHRAGGTVLCGGRRYPFEASERFPHVSFTLVAMALDFANDELGLVIEVDEPRSPAQEQLSGDTRLLGFGLEEITVRCREP